MERLETANQSANVRKIMCLFLAFTRIHTDLESSTPWVHAWIAIIDANSRAVCEFMHSDSRAKCGMKAIGMQRERDFYIFFTQFTNANISLFDDYKNFRLQRVLCACICHRKATPWWHTYLISLSHSICVCLIILVFQLFGALHTPLPATEYCICNTCNVYLWIRVLGLVVCRRINWKIICSDASQHMERIGAEDKYQNAKYKRVLMLNPTYWSTELPEL